MKSKISYPIRINRLLYLKNICSRRQADRLIEKNQVKINGKIAKLGQLVEKNDKVEISKKAEKVLKKRIYILFNKARGVVSHNPQKGEKEVNDFLPFSEKLFPVGRLDKDSRGLMLMTNDGRIVDKILNPKYNHRKKYLVEVDKRIDKFFLEKISGGIVIEKYRCKKAEVKKISPKKFEITLTEGKKHQIRRMVAALGYQTKDLKRLEIMNFKITGIKEGKYRVLNHKELEEIKKILEK